MPRTLLMPYLPLMDEDQLVAVIPLLEKVLFVGALSCSRLNRFSGGGERDRWNSRTELEKHLHKKTQGALEKYRKTWKRDLRKRLQKTRGAQP